MFLSIMIIHHVHVCRVGYLSNLHHLGQSEAVNFHSWIISIIKQHCVIINAYLFCIWDIFEYYTGCPHKLARSRRLLISYNKVGQHTHIWDLQVFTPTIEQLIGLLTFLQVHNVVRKSVK